MSIFVLYDLVNKEPRPTTPTEVQQFFLEKAGGNAAKEYTERPEFKSATAFARCLRMGHRVGSYGMSVSVAANPDTSGRSVPSRRLSRKGTKWFTG